MLLAHLRAADGQPLQPRRFNQRPGELARRPLEHRTGAGEGQRLLFAAQGVKAPGALRDGLRVVARKAEARRKHGQATLERHGGAVAHFHLRAGEGDCFAIQKHLRIHQHIGNLPAVSTGVHGHAATQRAGDAGGKFQPGKPGLLRGGGHALERRPGLGGQLLALHADAGKALAQRNHQPPHAAIAHNQVRAVAHQQRGNAQFARPGKRPGHFPGAVGQKEHVRRATHAHGGVFGHRFVYKNLFTGGNGIKPPYKLVDQNAFPH